MKNSKKYFLLVCLFPVFFLYSQAQTLPYEGVVSKVKTDFIFDPVPSIGRNTNRDFIPASPNAGSLGVYGQIPVGNFTGTAEISIPLYTVKSHDITLPIFLTYHSANVKPDSPHSLLGLGWSIQAGGVISRVIKGVPDVGPAPPVENPVPTMDYRKDNNWYSNSKLESLVRNNYELSFMQNVDPDEYYFNINGQSGKFYLDHNGSFRIQSTQGEVFNVSISIKTVNSDGRPQEILTGFQLTDTKGVKYTFGEENQSIEVTQTGFNKALYAAGDPTYFPAEYYQIPTSWYLSKIESSNGDIISFTYEPYLYLMRARIIDRSYCLQNGEKVDIVGSHPNPVEKANLITGWKLRKISTPYESVDFYSSKLSDGEFLDYRPIVKDDNYLDNYVFDRTMMTPAIELPKDSPYILDSIIFTKVNNEKFKTIIFDYTKGHSSRTKLWSLTFKGHPSTSDPITYKFRYNGITLPHFLSGKTDYYGYYNEKSFFCDELKNAVTSFTSKKISNEYDYIMIVNIIDSLKTPSPDWSKAELLEKIIYPTGGYTLFEYEPHEYGCVQKAWPFRIENKNNGNQYAGGQRIRSVQNYDLNGSLLTKKTYHYVKDYIDGGNTSSGVLAYVPRYTEYFKNKRQVHNKVVDQEMRISFFRITSSPIYPLSPQGNHITYSEVNVEEADGSFTTYKYKNYDNGYLDKEPLGYASHTLADSYSEYFGIVGMVEYWKDDEGISMELERGQLISEKVYDSNKNIKKETEYKYNDDPNRFNEQVRYFRYVPNGINIGRIVNSYRISAGVRYVYYPYLKEKIIRENEIEYKEFFEYDNNFRLLKKTIKNNSYGLDTLTTHVKYPNDVSGSIYSRMRSKWMHAYPVETEMKTNGVIMKREIYEYADTLNSDKDILLSRIKKQYKEGPFIHEQTINLYDSYGNPLETENISGTPTCYLWSYSGKYVIAIIENARYSQVIDLADQILLNNTINSSNPSNSSIDALANNLRAILPNSLVKSYTYKPLIGMTSMTDPRGISTYYEYDPLGRLIEVYLKENGQKQILETYEYHYGNQ